LAALVVPDDDAAVLERCGRRAAAALERIRLVQPGHQVVQRGRRVDLEVEREGGAVRTCAGDAERVARRGAPIEVHETGRTRRRGATGQELAAREDLRDAAASALEDAERLEDPASQIGRASCRETV